MRTNQEQIQWELQCYGCSKAELDQIVKEQCFPGTELMFAAGILSDAQEVLSGEFGEFNKATANQARQYINRAKYMIFNTMKEKMEAA